MLNVQTENGSVVSLVKSHVELLSLLLYNLYIIYLRGGVTERAAARRLVVEVRRTGGGGRPQPRAAPVPPSSRGPGLNTEPASQPPGHWSVGAFNKHFAVIQVP